MILRQVALLSGTSRVSFPELARVSAAIQRQVTRDFGPIWEVDATVDAFASAGDVPPGYWPVTVLDSIPVVNASGYHLDERGQPFAKILWSPTWSLAASHEILEMLADPFGSQTVSGPSVKSPNERVSYLVEVCDPCESSDCAYTINTGLAGKEVVVSDFYTPDYFDPVPIIGKRYSFGGNIGGPRQVLNGGYLSWQTTDGHIWQLFGPAEMGYFKDQGPGRLSRENTDAHTRALRAAPSATLTAASPGCKLTRDPVTGFLSGKTGDSVALNINGTSGTATFEDVNYDGTSIGGPGTSVSLTIKSGNRILRAVLDAVEGDLVELKESPCGLVLTSGIFHKMDPTLEDLHVVGS
jgi:hypothetical protein